ncbi:malate-2H(+)/Na(+)-lactate antiporter [bacterium BMS3Abin05]|nr:malate-2H(+)/Na(+)-lactate antiporter [bacterium BMS3Abin05]
MTQTTGWLSVIPPLLAIFLAIRTKQVYISLFLGIWAGWTILANWNPISGLNLALEACITVFKDPDNTKVIIFSAMIGALIAYTQRSGGVDGFIADITRKGIVRGRKSAQFLTWILAFVVFVESSINILVRASFARPLFDKLRISREKLAYICDSTSAPICVLIPFNAWGAYVLGLLDSQNIPQPMRVFAEGVPLNFYAISAILFVLFIILTDKDFGPMKEAERRVREEGKLLRDGAEPLVSEDVVMLASKPNIPKRSMNMIVPVLTMVAMMPVGLLITGHGSIEQGSGSTAVFWAVLAAIAVGAVMYRWQKIMTTSELTDLFLKGVGGLIPMAILMMLAFALGNTCKALGTGPYVAGLTKGWMHARYVPAVIFIVGAFIAFATGTSWGTFAIMIPIAIPMATIIGANLPLTLGAVLGGGVFGDHCSPISDTTIISSMASATDHIDHVRTQLPYALVSGAIALVLYLAAGFLF